MPDSTSHSAVQAQAGVRRRTPWWIRVVRAVLNVALLALLGLQLYALIIFSTHQHLALPGFLQSAIEQRLEDEGLAVRFGSLEVTLSGRLLVREPKIFLSGTPEPIAEADTLYAEPDWFSLVLRRKLNFSDLRLTDASLYCPPEVSPSGTRTPMVRNLSISLRGQGSRWWQLDYLRAQLFNAVIVADGTFQIPLSPPAAPTAPVKPAAVAPSLASRYLHWARQLAGAEPDFGQIKNPSLKIVLAAGEANRVRLDLVLRADGAKVPGTDAALGRGYARAVATWDGALLRFDGPASTWLDSVAYTQTSGNATPQEVFSGGPVWAQAWVADGPHGVFDGRLARIALIAGSSTIRGYACDSLAVDAGAAVVSRNSTAVPFKIAATRGLNCVEVSGRADDFKLGPEVNFRLTANFQDILSEARVELPVRLGSLKFDRPLSVEGRVALTPEHEPAAVDFVVDTGGAHFDAINLYALHARGRVSFDADPATHAPRLAALDLQSVSLWNPTWLVQGGYFHDFRTMDFRLLAHGNVDPHVLDGYIGAWWPGVWNFIVPGERWPSADIEYSGNWDEPSSENPVFGSVALAGARARGVLMDDIRLRIYQRHDVVAVYDLLAHDAAGGALSGAMYWLMKPPYLHTYEQRYIFDSTLPLADAATISGPQVVELVQPVDMPVAATIHVEQRTGGSSNPQPDVVSTRLIVHQPAAMHAYHVPLDSLDAEATIYDGLAEIPRFDFGIAGGQARANATLTRLDSQDNELTFRVTVQGARHAAFIHALGAFSSGNETTPPPTAPVAANASTSPLVDPNHKGFVDLAMGGRILLGQPDSLAAAGSAHVYDAELGEIHLFGGFSRALDHVGISLGSYELRGADGDFQIAHQYLRTPDLVITGPTARILAAGTYHFGDNRLNFNALVFPLGQIRTPGLAQIASMMEPFANTVTLALTGTADEPNWDASLHLLRMFENSTIACPVIPDYPATADGTPILPPVPEPPLLPTAPASPPAAPNASN